MGSVQAAFVCGRKEAEGGQAGGRRTIGGARRRLMLMQTRKRVAAAAENATAGSLFNEADNFFFWRVRECLLLQSDR